MIQKLTRKDLWIIEMCLEYMEPIKKDPNREKFCVNFDADYEHKKQEYKRLTGREWEAKKDGK